MKIGSSEPIIVREVVPKDFYLAQVIRNKEGSYVPLIKRLILNPDGLQSLSTAAFQKLVDWIINEVLFEKVLTVENWLEIGFHLSKQRWGSGLDWLESQPMSKVLVMLDIYEKFVEAQNEA